jgi:N-acetylglucosamine kinase-like BadF-type ATPase
MFVLGVDGGTTKTVALVANEQGEIIGAARGGGSNWSGEDVEIPMQVVADVSREALKKAGLSGNEIAAGVFTLAGADWPEDHTRREAVLSRASIAQKVIVKNDSFGGLRAGLTRPYGMVLAVGTGMNAAVITPQGQEWAFGYYETGGGSYSIADAAFTAVLRAEDGRGQPTLLTRLVLERLGYPTVEAMLRARVLGQIDYSKYFSLTPLVFEAAQAGDGVAAGILVQQGQVLAEYITAMARRFEMCSLVFDVVLAGGVFKGVGPILVDTLTQEIHRVVPQAQVVRAPREPSVGSVLLAYDALGIPVSGAMYACLDETAPNKDFFDTARDAAPTPTRPVEQE